MKKTKKKVAAAKTSKKTVSKIKAKALQIKKTSKKMADDVLLKVGPSLQSQMDKLNKQIKAQSAAMQDFKVMGLKVLQKAQEMSQTLKKASKTQKKITKASKKTKKKNG